MSVENTLKERGARYGSFEEHATIAQAIQNAYRVYPDKWDKLPPVIKQGFTTLADKIARTLNGDEYYDDNYHDIGGYAKLMEDWVKRQNNMPKLDLSFLKDDGVLDLTPAQETHTVNITIPPITPNFTGPSGLNPIHTIIREATK